MKVYVCDPVGHQRDRMVAGVKSVLGDDATRELPPALDARVSRGVVEAAGSETGAPAPRILLAHAQGVGRATPETEAWFATLEGFDLAILYSEAWLDLSPPVVELAKARWKTGTDLVLRNISPFLSFVRGRALADGISPGLLVTPSWAPLVREHVLGFLAFLLPAALTDIALTPQRLDACRSTLDRTVAEVERAREAGLPPSPGRAATASPWLFARGGLREMAEVGDPDDARSLAHGLLEDLLAAPLGTRSRAFVEWRDDLLRISDALAEGRAGSAGPGPTG